MKIHVHRRSSISLHDAMQKKRIAPSTVTFVARHITVHFIDTNYKMTYFSRINTFLSLTFQGRLPKSRVVQCHPHSISMIRSQ